MSGYRILIVDDDPVNHEILGEYLDLAGYQVLHAEDGAKGLEAMEREKPDLVLLDIQMPVMDGFRMMEAIQKGRETRNIPVLFLTSLDRDYLKVKGLELGAEDYITKPFKKAELLSRVKGALLRGRRYRKTMGALEGDLADMSLSDLLQTLRLTGKPAIIHLEEIDGEIFIDNGMLMHIRLGSFTNGKALQRTFFLERGRFSIEFIPLPPDIPRKSVSIEAALLTILPYIDELRAMMVSLPENNPLMEINPEGEGFPAVDKFLGISPILMNDLLVLMEGNLKENVEIMIRAIEKGKLKVIDH